MKNVSIREARTHLSQLVEQAVREADDPRVQRVPNDEVIADWHRQRAALLERAVSGRKSAETSLPPLSFSIKEEDVGD